MGVDADIWTALKSRATSLAVVSDARIAWPNLAFVRPDGNWLRVSWLPNRNRRLFIGSSAPHQRQGILQIDCYAPLNGGTNAALEMAEAVAAHFPCDLRLAAGSISLRITKAPDIGPALPNDTHEQRPVTMEYEVFA